MTKLFEASAMGMRNAVYDLAGIGDDYLRDVLRESFHQALILALHNPSLYKKAWWR